MAEVLLCRHPYSLDSLEDIHDSYKTGGNWYREMLIESSSFAASAGGGMLVAGYGTAIAGQALACLLAATPAGWVLVVVGLGVAAAAATTSKPNRLNEPNEPDRPNKPIDCAKRTHLVH
jgi:hypothetical protein